MSKGTRLALSLAGLILTRCAAFSLATLGVGDALVSIISCALLSSLCFLLAPREKKPPFKDIGKGAAMLLFFLSVSVFTSLVSGLVFPTPRAEISLFRGIVAVVLVPIAEELFFRGTVFSTLASFTPLPMALLLSSFIFAVCHGSVAAMITAFFSGLVLTLIYKKTGSLALAVVCHATNNLLALVLNFPKPFILPMILLSFFVCIFFIWKGFLKVDG